MPTAVAELGLADALAAAQRKIRVTGGAAPGTGGGAPALVHLDLPRWFVASEPTPWLRTLATAVRNRRAVRIGYRPGDRNGDRGAESNRVIRPLGLVNKAGTWYVVVAAEQARQAGGDAGGEERRAGGGAGSGDPAVFRVGRVSSAVVSRIRLPGRRIRPGRVLEPLVGVVHDQPAAARGAGQSVG